VQALACRDRLGSLKAELLTAVGSLKGLLRAGAAAWLMAAAAWLLSGCSAAKYRKSADQEIYRIVQSGQQAVFGQTNHFTIDTPYSNRKPEDIPPSELIDDRLQTNQRVLTIEQALELAVRHSREYQAAKEVLYRAGLSLSDTRYRYKPFLYQPVLAGGGNPIQIEDGRWMSNDPQDRGVARLTCSQLLQSGGRLGAILANDLFRYYSGDPQRAVITTLSVDLFQPLLRGFGRNNPEVEALTQAERDVVYAVRTFSFYQNQFALGIVNEYFALLGRKDTIRNRYTNYLGRVQATKRLEARAADRERLSDVDQARQAELTAKNTYVDAVAAYFDALDRFKITLGLPVGEKLYLDDHALRELDEAGLIPAALNPDEAYRFAVQKKLPLLNAIDRFEDSKRKVRRDADQLRADLNLFANASYRWEEVDDYSNFDADLIRYGAGVNLNLPFDRHVERNNYRSTLITFESQLRALTLELDRLRESIQGGLRALAQRRQNYEIQKSALILANRRVESTTLLLQAGRSEVRDLVEAQDAQIAAQNAVTTAMVAYLQERLQLMLDIGALETTSAKFWLQDQLAAHFQPGAKDPTQLDLPREELIPPQVIFEPTPSQ
jgi:outer membrane protein TolC